jgi:hypothetical protein
MKKTYLDLLLAFVMGMAFIIWIFWASLAHTKPEPPPEQPQFCLSVLKVVRTDTNEVLGCYTHTTEDKNRQQFFIQDSVIIKQYYIVRR